MCRGVPRPANEKTSGSEPLSRPEPSTGSTKSGFPDRRALEVHTSDLGFELVIHIHQREQAAKTCQHFLKMI